MKKIFIILGAFVVLLSACETDFDVNAEWKAITVVYGLLDAGKELQQIKISKTFLGEMDALQMAQYADSINIDIDELDVKIYKWNFNQIQDSVILTAVPTIRDGDIFNDTIIIYEFLNDDFLEPDFEYELVIKNKSSGNLVTAKTEIISGFNFKF